MSSQAIVRSGSGFFEKFILGMIANMPSGRLEMRMPDGQSLSFGNGEGNVNACVEVKDPYFFKRCVLYGDIGFGESYVEGEWETDNITNVIKWFLLNVEQAPAVSGSEVKHVALNLLRIFNHAGHRRRVNSLRGSRKNIADHYDLNNDFFALFLDPGMTYSSAYFKDAHMTLEEAQNAKYERLCRQLHLKANDHVLEIGSGWGSNAIYMAKHYGCRVTTVTISEEQYRLAKERIAKEGLAESIEILLCDYRDLHGQYDKIVSIEMLEAVGADYYELYFKTCDALLKKKGLLALQVITCPDSRFESLKNGVDWIQKHIFPGSLLPSVAAINTAINKTSDLTLVDLKDIGLHYAHTLQAWHTAFNSRIREVRGLGFDDYFIRKWNYYLCYCEAAFAMRHINVMQMVYTRPNNTSR